MFGYVRINQPEMKFRDYDVYHAHYCGLCEALKRRHGRVGQLTLNYDMTFLSLLLSALYEPEIQERCRRCLVHPLHEHCERSSEYADYAADMNILIAWRKCMDDWRDEKKHVRRIMASLLGRKLKAVRAAYPDKMAVLEQAFDELQTAESACAEMTDPDNAAVDRLSGLFGNIMAELFVYRKDRWEQDLRTMGFALGKFIYLCDAWEDREEDRDRHRFNVLDLYSPSSEDMEPEIENLLTLLMGECTRAFERLPIVRDTDILRNILYSGVWTRYEAARSLPPGQKAPAKPRFWRF